VSSEAPASGEGAAVGALPDTLPDRTETDTAVAEIGDADAAVAAAPVDGVALARIYSEPLFKLPQDLYIPPDALEVFLETFEGPLDLLLYLIRRQNFNIFDIPLAQVTRQYLEYVEQIRARNLELAAEYLLMAAMLIEIKSRMLLPSKPSEDGGEPEDPRAELVRRLQGVRFVEFQDLFDTDHGPTVMVVTFIAMLELSRERLLEVTQAEAFAPIYVRLAYQPLE